MMKRILIALALLWAAPASANLDYYVSPQGVDNATRGTTAATPWKTFAYAVAHLAQANTANGDVTLHMVGDIRQGGDFPDPPNLPADGKHYFFVGSNALIPSATRINGGGISTPYLSLKYVQIESPLTLDSTASRDSIVSCRTAGFYNNGADYMVFERNAVVITGNGRAGKCFNIGNTTGGATLTMRPVIRYNTFDIGRGTTDEGPVALFLFGGGPQYGIVDSALIEWNVGNFTVEDYSGNSGGFPVIAFFHTQRHVQNYNHWYITNNRVNTGGWAIYNLMVKYRYGSNRITINGDSTYVTGPGTSDIWLTQCCGDASTGSTDQVRNVTVDSSFYYVENGSIEFHSGMRWGAVTYTTFVNAGGKALVVRDSVVGTNSINHCTLVGQHGSGVDGKGAVFTMNDALTWHASATLALTNNIYASPNTHYPIANEACAPGGDLGKSWAGFTPPQTSEYYGKLNSNNNLFSVGVFDANPGDMSIAYNKQGDAKHCSGVGDNSLWELLYVPAANDSLSKYGSAEFAYGGAVGDSVAGRYFNAAIGPLSAARGIGTSATDAGAVAFVSGAAVDILAGSSFDFTRELCPVMLARSVLIFNPGTDDLEISAATSTSDRIGSFTSLPLVIAAGAVGQLDFVYTSSGSGCLVPVARSITLTTDAPGRETITIPVVQAEATASTEE